LLLYSFVTTILLNIRLRLMHPFILFVFNTLRLIAILINRMWVYIIVANRVFLFYYHLRNYYKLSLIFRITLIRCTVEIFFLICVEFSCFLRLSEINYARMFFHLPLSISFDWFWSFYLDSNVWDIKIIHHWSCIMVY